MLRIHNKYSIGQGWIKNPARLNFIWFAITGLIGLINSTTYWDYKYLLMSYMPAGIMFFVATLAMSEDLIIQVCRVFLKLMPLLLMALYPYAYINDFEAYPRSVIFTLFFLLLWPSLNFRQKLIVGVVSFFALTIDISFRSNTIKYASAIMVLFLYYGRVVRSRLLMNIFLVGIFAMPVVLLYTASEGIFNVFQENSVDVNVETGGTENANTSATSNLSDDTRTFLYTEVITSVSKKNQSFIYGAGGAANYESILVSDDALDGLGRYSTEVAFLNALLHGGGIQVMLYAYAIFYSAYLAINRSNNAYIKIMGAFVSVRWLIYFVEDNFKIDFNTFLIWFMVGLCCSEKIRSLSDCDFRKIVSKI
jgi:hypothetical protein